MRLTSHYISINYSCTKVAKCKPVTVLSIVLVTMNMSNNLPPISRFHNTALTTESQHCKKETVHHLQPSDLHRYHTPLSLTLLITTQLVTTRYAPSESVTKACLPIQQINNDYCTIIQPCKLNSKYY
jgi:hypothetical protein